MKKLFTSFALALLIASPIAVAQTNFSDSFTLPRTATEKNRDLVTIDPSGNVYVAGLFTQDLFEFGTSEMEGITGGSTYLIKYAPDGTKQWGVAITGAATPSAITTDAAGNVYLSGVYADRITINGTSGAPVLYEGMVDGTGSPITDKNAGYLVKYSPAGVVLKSQDFRPEAYPSTPDAYVNYRRFFNIAKMVVADNKLYAAIRHSSKITNNGVEINGPYIFADGWMDSDPAAVSFVIFNNDLQAQEVLTKVQSKGNFDMGTPSIDVAGNQCVISTTAIGEVEVIDMNGTSTTIQIPDGAGFDKKVADLVGMIDLSARTLGGQTFISTEESGTGSFFNTITDLRLFNNQVMIAGVFKGGLSFNNTKVAQGTTDFFQANLSTSDLSVVDTKVAGTAGDEILNAAQFIDGGYILFGNAGAANGIKATMGSELVEPLEANKFYSGATANGSSRIHITLDKSVTPATFNINAGAIPTSVENAFESKIRVYPNPVVDQLYFSATADAVVFNAIGEEILKVKGVNNLNMSSLAKGVYFVKVTIEEEVKTISIVKE